MLSLSDVKAGNYAAMVVFNLLKDNRNNIALEEIAQLFPSVLEVAAKESEFGYICKLYIHIVFWFDLLSKTYSVAHTVHTS